MTSDTPKTAMRNELIKAAARLIATEGEAGLTVRRVADKAGTSTMAVYTHFGGMAGLRYGVRREGFARLAARLSEVDASADPVANLALLGLAYFTNATEEPELYRVMFLEPPHDAIDAEIGWDTFDVLVQGVQQCIAAGRFHRTDAADLATQLWALTHGTVTLHLAGLLPADGAINTLGAAALHLFTSYGDQRDTARQSLRDALARSGLAAAHDVNAPARLTLSATNRQTQQAR